MSSCRQFLSVVLPCLYGAGLGEFGDDLVVVVVEDGCGDNAVGGVIDAGGFGVEGEVAVFVLGHEVSLSGAGGIAVLLCLYCTSIFRCLCDIWAHMSLYDK